LGVRKDVNMEPQRFFTSELQGNHRGLPLWTHTIPISISTLNGFCSQLRPLYSELRYSIRMRISHRLIARPQAAAQKNSSKLRAAVEASIMPRAAAPRTAAVA
jgi:hypothetical protein